MGKPSETFGAIAAGDINMGGDINGSGATWAGESKPTSPCISTSPPRDGCVEGMKGVAPDIALETQVYTSMDVLVMYDDCDCDDDDVAADEDGGSDGVASAQAAVRIMAGGGIRTARLLDGGRGCTDHDAA